MELGQKAQPVSSESPSVSARDGRMGVTSFKILCGMTQTMNQCHHLAIF